MSIFVVRGPDSHLRISDLPLRSNRCGPYREGDCSTFGSAATSATSLVWWLTPSLWKTPLEMPARGAVTTAARY